MIAVYLISLVLNYGNILKHRGRSISPLFSLIRDLGFILIFNVSFNFLALLFGVSFLKVNIFLVLWGLSFVIYLLKFKFICLTHTGFICFVLSLALGFEFPICEILFLIGVLHIFEGVYVILNSNSKLNLYLPLSLSGLGMIFFIHYGRNKQKIQLVGFKNFSGALVFLYGVLVLILSRVIVRSLFGILGFLFVVLVHEFIDRMDGIIYFKFWKIRRDVF